MATQDRPIINNITINETPVEKVETFTYLGSLFRQEAKIVILTLKQSWETDKDCCHL